MEVAKIQVTFSPNSGLLKCVEILATKDNVIEDDESFTVLLSQQTILPVSLQDNLVIGTSSATITIQDTSNAQ